MDLADAVVGVVNRIPVEGPALAPVAPDGTAPDAAVPGYRVAGKTGTAWKFATGGYSEDKYISIFAGMAPASSPRLAMVVVVNEPTAGKYYGGTVAAPVFASVVSGALRLLDVSPDDISEDRLLMATHINSASQESDR